MVKNLPANAGDIGSIPGLGRFPGVGSGNPLQYSCLENSMDRGVAKSQIRLSTHIQLVYWGYRGLQSKVIIPGRVQDS